jgi:mRNA interferase RelE/StbE
VVRVRLAAQVVEFVRRQAPEPRRRLRQAIRELAAGRGDVKPLEGPLQEYCRLRVGPYRIVLRYATAKTVECVFAERRGLVYEVFAEAMLDRLLGVAADADEDDDGDAEG